MKQFKFHEKEAPCHVRKERKQQLLLRMADAGRRHLHSGAADARDPRPVEKSCRGMGDVFKPLRIELEPLRRLRQTGVRDGTDCV